MSNQRITPLTESGLLTAVTVIMAITAVYVPILCTAAALLWPLPMTILTVRHGMRWGIMSVIVSGVIMAMLIEPLASLRVVLIFAPVGLALGYGFRRAYPAMHTFLLSLAISIASLAAVMLAILFLTGVNPFTLQMDMLNQSFQDSLDIYRSMNVDEASLTESAHEFQQAMSTISLLLPLAILLSGTILTFLNYAIAAKILHRLGHNLPEMPSFAEWHFPKAFLYLMGFALVGIYWGSTRNLSLLYQISLNISLLTFFVGFIQGASLIYCWATHKRLSKWLIWIILMLILFCSPLMQILAFVGFGDMIFDYRRRLRS